MKADPEQRAVQLGEYIAAHNATVRAAAALFARVQAVLARNKAERHLRGGAATRRRYSRR